MPIDMTTPGSPGWYLKRLGTKLVARRARYDVLAAYYSGNHPLPEGDERVREFYKKFQRKARTNYCGLIADATAERIRREGIDVGTVGTDEQRQAGNDLARAIWQANNMDAASRLVHATALQLGDAYVIVGPAPEGRQFPLITPEDPRQVIVETDPADPRVIRAGLKTWDDTTTKTRHAIVYLPTGFHYFRARGTTRSFGSSSWEPEKDAAPNKLNRPPIARFVGRPHGFEGEGLAEFEDCIDIQDRINDTVLNRIVITKMQAFRQRWVKGMKMEDEDGNEIKLFPGSDLVWAVEDEKVEFGDFDQADLSPLLEAAKDDITAIVNLSGLPPQYVAGGLVNVGADAIVATDARQVDKAKDRMAYYSDPWEDIDRMAFAWMDQGDLIGADAEVRWADPERRSVAQLADAATKYESAGVPWRARMRLLGYSDVEIAELETERAAELAEMAAFAPPPATIPS